MDQKIEALADHLNLNDKETLKIEVNNKANTFEYDGEEFLILTETEAADYLIDYEKDLQSEYDELIDRIMFEGFSSAYIEWDKYWDDNLSMEDLEFEEIYIHNKSFYIGTC